MSQIEVRNPWTGKFDYVFAESSAEEITNKVQKLRRNQASWSDSEINERAAILVKFADSIQANDENILAALAEDTGRWALSVMEINALQGIIRQRAKEAPMVVKEHRIGSHLTSVMNLQRAVPYPVLAVISPWNYPLILSFIDAVPALLAGCSVIIKPSEVTPRFIEPIAKALADVPELDAVVEIVPGAAKVGGALIDLTDAVNFTGSVPTGRKVAAAAAAQLKPAFLELGGKDPAIVLESADIEKAAQSIMYCGMLNSGQTCFSIERVYAHRTVSDRLINRMCELASEMTLNVDDISDGQIGPFIFGDQREIAKAHLNDAVALGAKICCGGEFVDSGGSWMIPTILRDVDHSMRIMVEETFAPIVPVMQFGSEDEAIALANDTEYGLCAAVFGKEKEAERIGRKLEAGGVYCNDVDLIRQAHPGVEKMGFKNSGLGGSRYGPEGFRRFTRSQALIFQHGESAGICRL